MPDSTTQFACGAAGKREADDPDQAASPGAIGATIQRLFTGRDRGRASGYLGGVVGISTAAGPLLGGVLSQAIGTHNDWRWVFLVNLFLGMVEVPVAIKLLPRRQNFRIYRNGRVGACHDCGWTAGFRAGAKVITRSELAVLPDSELLVRLRELPPYDAERDCVCEVLVDRYAGLVRACVRRYRNSPEPAEDLMQVGYVGLLKAINNFDPAFGNGLSAYAEPCVSGEIKRHFRDKRWQVRVSRQAQELLLAIRTADEQLTQQLGRAPEDSELARRLGVTPADVLEARQADLVFSAYSLDAPLSDSDEPALLADVLGEDDAAVEHTIDIEAVHVHVDELPEREQRILMMRFYGNLTQGEIGERLGISQMHVSRLLRKALTYLHHCLTTDDPQPTG